MSRKRVDLLLENVKIEAVAAEGKALAHVDGMVVFVDFAVPGDVVDIQVFKKKKNYMEGWIKRIVKPSEHRLEPILTCLKYGPHSPLRTLNTIVTNWNSALQHLAGS